MNEQVLIAEDNPDLQIIFDAAFKFAGFDVKVAPDGLEAIKLLSDATLPTALILDLNMPGATGMEVLEHMRQQGLLEKVIIVVVTGNTVAGRFIDTKMVDMVLLKPVEPLDLIAITKRRIQGKQKKN